MNTSTVTSPDGTTIAYDRTGAGEPLILVAGAFSYRRYPGQVKVDLDYLKLADARDDRISLIVFMPAR